MKNVKITLNNGLVVSDQNLYEDPTDFVSHIVSTNYWGKPERWVRAKIDREFAITDDNPDGWWYPDEQYEDEDVLETETRTKLEIETEWVKLRAEYTIEITDYVPPVPTAITPRQARLALNHFNLRDAVETAIASADQNTKDEWEFANEVRRDWTSLTLLANQIGITSAQLDELFKYGSEL